MSRSLLLSIPEPCHENWNGMSPSEKGRFCGACQKQVIDFSTMTDQELQSFFLKKNNSNVCGRFSGDQLNRDIQIPKKKLPWVKYVIQATIPAMLYSTKVMAQGEVRVRQDTVKVKANEVMMGKIVPRRTTEEVCSPAPITVYGTVLDDDGNRLAGVTVIVKGTKMTELTDENGLYSFKVNAKDFPVELMFTNVSFSTVVLTETAVPTDGNKLRRNVTMRKEEIEVYYAGFVVATKKKEPIPLITNLVDTVTRLFKSYPNPVMSGSNINIEWKGMEEGYFQLNLADVNGKIVHQREIWIDKEARLLNFNIPTVPAGQYLLTMANKKTGKIHTEKLLIQ